MYKKLTAIVLALVMCLSLAACSAGGSGETTAEQEISGGGGTTEAVSETSLPEGTESSDTSGAQTAGASESDGEVFKIGCFLQLTGNNAINGTEARDSLVMAADYINANGGFNGVPVELVIYDTQGSAEEAVKVVNRLIEIDGVQAAIGSVNSNEVLAAAGYLNDAGIYTFGLGTSPTWMEEDWPYVFRATMNNAYVVPIVLDMIEETGITKMATFYGQDDASLTTAEEFETQAKERGIEIVDSESYDVGDTDFSAQIASILASGAQGVYLSLSGENIPLTVSQLRQYGYTGLIFNKESFMNLYIEMAGQENSNYIAFSNPYVTYNSVEDVTIPIVKEFCQRYEGTYGTINASECAYRAWDTMMAMWEASKIAGSNDPEDLRVATNQISGLEALGGTMDFTSGNREAFETFNKFILIDGKNILWDDWMAEGGYDAYKEATGNEY